MEGKQGRKLVQAAIMAALLAGSLGGLNTPGNVSAQTPQPTQPVAQSPQDREFADPTFEHLWRRTDWLVTMGKVKRSYFWGPGPNSDGLMEDYEQGTGGKHLVQYFDKSRMEINHPDADRKNPFFVTNGLLTMELISGNMQTGDNSFVLRWPANLPIASDVDDASAPTYASFRGAIARVDTNNVGKVVTSLIYKSGALDFEHGGAPYANYDTFNVKNAYYEATTKHNIPDVFWTFLNSKGPVLNDDMVTVSARLQDPYFYATGYPIADAYWSSVKIEGKVSTPVLIQPYQRRVLTYVPSAPDGFKVQMGNIGQHYYDWRYKDAGKPPTLTGKCGLGYPALGFGKVYENNVVKFQLGCQQGPEAGMTVTRQPFERGQVIGVTHYDFYSGHDYEDVFVLFNDGTAYTSSFIQADDNAPGPVPTPVPGSIPSPRVIALVLAADLSLGQRIGNATAPAETIAAVRDTTTGTTTGGSPVQYFDGGIMVYPNVAVRKIYVLYNTSGYAYTNQGPHVRMINADRWSVYDDIFAP